LERGEGWESSWRRSQLGLSHRWERDREGVVVGCMRDARRSRQPKRGTGNMAAAGTPFSLGGGMQPTTTPSLFTLVLFAREMRRKPERSEALLWAQLRRRQLGVRFRRQHPFEVGFIVDFYAASARLVVEIDGAVHRRVGAPERDAARQQAIELAYGVRFLRLDAGLVERDTFAAVERVRAAL
jgi:very-short-patch-repair endonuclease